MLEGHKTALRQIKQKYFTLLWPLEKYHFLQILQSNQLQIVCHIFNNMKWFYSLLMYILLLSQIENKYNTRCKIVINLNHTYAVLFYLALHRRLCSFDLIWFLFPLLIKLRMCLLNALLGVLCKCIVNFNLVLIEITL